jgi:hypothetical protein
MAGQEPGEPVPPNGCGYTGRSIWYSWTAPAEGSVWLNAWFFHTENGCVRLAVFTGTVLTNLTLIGLGGDGYMTFETDPGQTYQIVMNTSSETDPLVADLVFTPSPANNLSLPAPADAHRQSLSVMQPAAFRISLQGQQIKVTWPATATGRLESTTNLTSPDSWEPVQAEVVVEGDENTVTLPNASERMFFRLRGE